MSNSRTKNSVYIMISGIVFKLITLLLSFINRTVFINFLGIEYLGVNSLFTNILSLLSLTELGFGSAITYFLYKPLAEKDIEKLKDIMKFYKMIYRVIGLTILIIGMLLIPFLDNIIKLNNNVNINIYPIYFLFLFNTVLSYLFFAYRSNIISADQKSYLLNNINCIFTVISNITQILVIVLFKNFILSLIAMILIGIINNIIISIRAGKIYPFLNEKNNRKLPIKLIKEILSKVYSIFIFKLSSQLFTSTDNMIISAVVGTVFVGYNANYLLLISSVVSILKIIVGSFTAAVGNINATEAVEIKYTMFKKLDFVNFWLCSFCAICFSQLLNPFITLWIGKEFLFSQSIVNIIVANFLTESLLNIVFMYRETMGLFEYGRYTQLIGGICNIILSLVLARYWGVFGVFLATLISGVFITIIPFPIILYKHGFNKSSKEYLIRYLLYLILTIIAGLIVSICCSIFKELNYLTFIGQMMFCIFIPNILYLIIFKKTEEYIYVKNKVKIIINKIIMKNFN